MPTVYHNFLFDTIEKSKSPKIMGKHHFYTESLLNNLDKIAFLVHNK